MKNSIKNFLIDGKSFFDLPVKNKEEAYEKVIEISSNNVYTTGNLLDYGYFWNNYKLIAVDLSKNYDLENLDLKQKLILLENLKMKQQCFPEIRRISI